MSDKQQFEVISSWVHLATTLQSLEVSLHQNERLKDQSRENGLLGEDEENKTLGDFWFWLEIGSSDSGRDQICSFGNTKLARLQYGTKVMKFNGVYPVSGEW